MPLPMHCWLDAGKNRVEALILRFAARKALACHPQRNAVGSFSMRGTSEIYAIASSFSLSCVFSTPVFLMSCEHLSPRFVWGEASSFSRVRFYTGEDGEPTSTPNSPIEPWHLFQERHEFRQWQATSGED